MTAVFKLVRFLAGLAWQLAVMTVQLLAAIFAQLFKTGVMAGQRQADEVRVNRKQQERVVRAHLYRPGRDDEL